jgi:pimeloyl-ACP methyl ester carboxylesterase
MWANFDEAQRRTILEDGQLDLPSEYSDEPYIITAKLIEDGRNQLVLRTPLSLPFPVRFLQGTEDADVDQSVALRLLDHVSGEDVRLTLVKGANHSFSTPECLVMITDAIEQVSV